MYKLSGSGLDLACSLIALLFAWTCHVLTVDADFDELR